MKFNISTISRGTPQTFIEFVASLPNGAIFGSHESIYLKLACGAGVVNMVSSEFIQRPETYFSCATNKFIHFKNVTLDVAP